MSIIAACLPTYGPLFAHFGGVKSFVSSVWFERLNGRSSSAAGTGASKPYSKNGPNSSMKSGQTTEHRIEMSRNTSRKWWGHQDNNSTGSSTYDLVPEIAVQV
jgi:hypothetical protein